MTNFSEEISGEFNVRPSPQPSPHRINSVFDLDQFLKIDHIPGLEVSLQFYFLNNSTVNANFACYKAKC